MSDQEHDDQHYNRWGLKPIIVPIKQNGTEHQDIEINLDDYKLTLDHKVQHVPDVWTINGFTILRNQEFGNICGLPGTGKSSIQETIILAFLVNFYKYLNIDYNLDYIDTNGIAFESSGMEMCIIDTERPPDDNRISMQHIQDALDLEKHPKLKNGNEILGLTYLMFAEEGDIPKLKVMLEKVYEDPRFKLVIIDGVLDFVASMNDDKDTSQVVKWIRTMTVKYDKVTITTLHPNKGSENLAGHLGAMIYRWCRASLLLRVNKDDRSVKELISDFDMGKLKHSDMYEFPGIYWKWSDSQKRMMPAEKPEANAKYDANAMDQVFTDWKIKGKDKVPSKEFKERYAEILGIKESGVRPHIASAIETGFLVSEGTYNNTVYFKNDDLPF